MINSTWISNSKIFEKNFQVFISQVSLSTTSTAVVALELFKSDRLGYRFMPFWIAHYVISKTGTASYSYSYGALASATGGVDYRQWVDITTFLGATGTSAILTIRGDTTAGKRALANDVSFYLAITPSSTSSSAATVRTFVKGYWVIE